MPPKNSCAFLALKPLRLVNKRAETYSHDVIHDNFRLTQVGALKASNTKSLFCHTKGYSHSHKHAKE